MALVIAGARSWLLSASGTADRSRAGSHLHVCAAFESGKNRERRGREGAHYRPVENADEGGKRSRPRRAITLPRVPLAFRSWHSDGNELAKK